ncbi:hypothetical protein HGRIS_005801 [Hohenbuehelia grisea]|uniref:Dynactin subunit 4 n=1 Tax=Hohenbuehelia grisea TaxID=104357 RepID=A0ABR3JZE3_9AGAR
MVGEPPFFLYCNHCRWDSAEVGITFEKPTGLAAQLQKSEDSAPESLEFDRLKEHFEPFVRATTQLSSSAAHAAANAALHRDVPAAGSKFSSHPRMSSRGKKDKDNSQNKDEMAMYQSRVATKTAANSLGSGGQLDVDMIRGLETPYDVATMEQRWLSSWAISPKIDDLKPFRIPLHAKRTKRCPTCTHILIKPEQKAQSVRYKIKLVAATYLPAITIALPHVQALASLSDKDRRALNKSTAAGVDDERMQESQGGMHAGKTYPFHLALTNPLYDPIQVKLSVQRVHVSAPTPGPAPTVTTTAESAPSQPAPEKARRPPFAVSLPTSVFNVAAFVEAWEYEDDEDMFDDETLGIGTGHGAGARSGRDREGKAKAKSVGVLERKANMTLIGGEVVIGKEALGNVKFNMLVTYTYRSDDAGPPESSGVTDTPTKTGSSKPLLQPEVKTFSFYTVVDLGPIIPKAEPKPDPFEV